MQQSAVGSDVPERRNVGAAALPSGGEANGWKPKRIPAHPVDREAAGEVLSAKYEHVPAAEDSKAAAAAVDLLDQSVERTARPEHSAAVPQQHKLRVSVEHPGAIQSIAANPQRETIHSADVRLQQRARGDQSNGESVHQHRQRFSGQRKNNHGTELRHHDQHSVDPSAAAKSSRDAIAAV